MPTRCYKIFSPYPQFFFTSMESNKAHRGTKESSKKTKQHANGYNARAFGVANAGKLDRMARRSVDVGEKRFHAPMVDRTPEEAPPVLVAVVGPKGVGKSTLIKSLVKRFTKHTVGELNGPVTVVSGKKRRITFFECGTDLNSMIDVAKVADLVLLMIDGNFGFEMETMEFLQIASVHGFPRVLGIVTHLDLFKNISQARAAKKALKQRFWTEVYKGAKLFYLSGVMNSRYPDREILNLARFISVMKFRPLKWRNEHPYLLCDRFTDLTHPQDIERNPKTDRQIALYGYLRGTPLKMGQSVHIPGMGDAVVSDVEQLSDPCPTPAAIKREEELAQSGSSSGGKTGRRKLDDKLKTIYAPMSDVGGVKIDKDAVYIDVGSNAFNPEENKNAGLGERMVMDLQKGGIGADDEQQAMADGIQLFSNSAAIKDLEDLEDDDEEVDDEDVNEDRGRTALREAKSYHSSQNGIQNAGGDEEYDFASDSDMEDLDFSESKWKDKFIPANYANSLPLGRMIYSDVSAEEVIKRWHNNEDDIEQNEEGGDNNEEDDELFTKKKQVDYSEKPRLQYPSSSSSDDNVIDIKSLDNLFYREVKFDGEQNQDGDDDKYEDSEGGSDFEDLEKGDGDDSALEEQSDKANLEKTEEDKAIKSVEEQRAENAKKKEQMRLQFDSDEEKEDEANVEDEAAESWYDRQKNRISKQLEINEAELADLDAVTRRQIEGFRAGSYVRLVFNEVPCEFSEYFNPKFPIIVGGLLTNETRFGFSQVRIKKHRWYPRLLKTNDPVVMSLGWRRFQTCPIFTTSDSRTRTRMLKYSPEHMFCNATIWGPLVSPNTGFACFPSVSEKDAAANFRVSATGTVEEVDQEVEIVKKLKLVGHPYKIFKNTAFIKDMFHSSLEIARFEGAQIKTVSGIRGQIKRALTTEGCYRATFEDKILMSDIILLRAWWPVRARQFYNPVTSLLLRDKTSWQGMRQIGAIRAERKLSAPQKKDSAYGPPVERETRRFNPLHVPKTLQANLPFKSQIAQMAPQSKKTYMQKRAVVTDGVDKDLRDMMVKVNTLRNEKDAKRYAKKQAERAKLDAERQKEFDRKEAKRRENRKEYFAKEGRKRAAEESAMSNPKRSK